MYNMYNEKTKVIITMLLIACVSYLFGLIVGASIGW